MIFKIDRKEAITRFQNLPLRHYDIKEDEEVFNYPKVFANYILTLPSKSYKGHIKMFGEELVKLLEALKCDYLIFLGDSDLAWLRRFKEHESFEDSFQYLISNKIGKRFNGAIQVPLSEIPLFIKHLAWLVRTNGIVQYVHFVDPNQNIICDICQYGNLHISSKTKAADILLKNAVSNIKFEYLCEDTCYNKFSKSSSIKGRQITV